MKKAIVDTLPVVLPAGVSAAVFAPHRRWRHGRRLPPGHPRGQPPSAYSRWRARRR